MQVSLDGGRTWTPTEEIRVLCEGTTGPDGEDTGMTILINHEGIIIDGLDENGEVVGTRASTYDEIEESLQ